MLDAAQLGHLLRNAIFGASAFAVGLALYLTAIDGRRYLARRERLYGAFALTWAGLALTVGLILWYVVAPISDLGTRPETWSYAIGLAMVAIGTVGIGVERRRESTKGT